MYAVKKHYLYYYFNIKKFFLKVYRRDDFVLSMLLASVGYNDKLCFHVVFAAYHRYDKKSICYIVLEQHLLQDMI